MANPEAPLNKPAAPLTAAPGLRWLLRPHGASRMALTGLVGMLLVITVDRITHPLIEQQQRMERQRVLHELFAETGENAFDHLDSVTIATGRPHQPPLTVDRVWRHGQVEGLFLQVTTPEGYNGDITYALAMDRHHVLLGVRVLRHRETPGLGDQIEKRRSPWIQRFVGASLTHPASGDWAVRRDGGAFDQFTGATITPRAVVNSLRETLEQIALHPELFHPLPGATVNPALP